MNKNVVCRTLLSALGTGLLAVAYAQTTTEQTIKPLGIGSLNANRAAAAPLEPSKTVVRKIIRGDLINGRKSSITGAVLAQTQLANPTPVPKTVIGAGPNFFGFPGLNVLDSTIANGGFLGEPPDQGLSVGNGFVLEAVNSALTLFDAATGYQLTYPTEATAFFGLPSNGYVSDPRVYFDHQLQRWFVSILTLDVDAMGRLTGHTAVLIAVSTSGNPLLNFNLFRIDTTDDGSFGTPAHPGCPCFGDQPLIGADAHGFYVSTNEFAFQGGFNGAQIYAMSKVVLASGGTPTVLHFSGLPLAEAVAYSVQPAMSIEFASEPASGVEYLLSSLDFTGTLDNRIAVWALLNTSSLTNAHPHVGLVHKVVTSEVYGQPPPALQPRGPFPFGMSLGDSEEYLDTNDDRMQQVVYENGHLWSGLNTVVGVDRGTRAGIAYFIVDPSVAGATVDATFTYQGYVAAPGQDSVIFPSIGVTPAGKAAMTFTLVGPTTTPAFTFTAGFYPSMAFTKVSAAAGAGAIQLGAAGSAPEDGFSGYPQFGGNQVARWGDYSAAVADTDGSIWMAAEWIPSTPTFPVGFPANWGTFIGQLKP